MSSSNDEAGLDKRRRLKEEEEEKDNIDEHSSSPECGLGGFKPRVLQACANPFGFVITYSISGLVTSTLFTYVNSQVTTLERQFGFSSSQTGVIMAANDIGFLSCILLFSHLALSLHIPRTLAVVTIGFGLSGIVCSLPHFLFGNAEIISSVSTNDSSQLQMLSPSSPNFNDELCVLGENRTSTNCDTDGSQHSQPAYIRGLQHSQTALILIVAGMVVQGMCKSPRWPYVSFYVDGNVDDKTKSGFYLGIVIATGIFGPVLAFVLGGVFTRLYVTLKPTELTPTHPKWIGAWWLGFLIFGIASLFSALPLFCFPGWMRGKKPRTSVTKSSLSMLSETESRTNFRQTLQRAKEVPSAMWRLVTNPIYMCLALSGCMLVFSIGGAQAFLPKYMENQFSLPAWKANTIMALTSIATAPGGTLLGGWLTRRFKMTPLTGLKLVTILYVCGTLTAATGFFLKCPQPNVFNRPSDASGAASCMGECGCEATGYLPVCGSDSKTYYSPCHAGCQVALDENTYTNCSCIDGTMATAGTCDYQCIAVYIHAIFGAISSFCGTLAIMPIVVVYLRCVEPRDKPLAMGCVSFMTSVLGWLLGPIIFGGMIDGVCDVWDSSCGGRGSCLLYDNDVFRVRYHAYVISGRVLSTILIALAYLAARFTKRLERLAAMETNDVRSGHHDDSKMNFLVNE